MPNGEGKKKEKKTPDAKRKRSRGEVVRSRVLAFRRKKAPSKGLEGISAGKAKFILREGIWNGKKLTQRQRGMLGVIAGGGKLTRLKKQKKARERIGREYVRK